MSFVVPQFAPDPCAIRQGVVVVAENPDLTRLLDVGTGVSQELLGIRVL